MDYFAGLDVSVKETSVCIVDDTGKIVREVKVASEPEALLQVLKNPAYRFKRIGLEAGPLSQWLFSALAEFGLRSRRSNQETVTSEMGFSDQFAMQKFRAAPVETGQERRFDDLCAMSAHPPIASEKGRFRDGRKVPLADITLVIRRHRGFNLDRTGTSIPQGDDHASN
jgi:hypothetical protein